MKLLRLRGLSAAARLGVGRAPAAEPRLYVLRDGDHLLRRELLLERLHLLAVLDAVLQHRDHRVVGAAGEECGVDGLDVLVLAQRRLRRAPRGSVAFLAVLAVQRLTVRRLGRETGRGADEERGAADQ